MARVILSTAIGTLRGRIGDLVYTTRNGRVFVRARPAPSKNPPTDAQLEARFRFARAAIYAREANSEPVTGAFYTAIASRNGTTAYAEAVADFLLPPVVTDIKLAAYHGCPGNPISVLADDRHGVTGVTVTIRDKRGVVLETGAAKHGRRQWIWRPALQLRPDHRVTIEAVATDRPGNTGSAIVPFGIEQP